MKKINLILFGCLSLGINLSALTITTDTTALDLANQTQVVPTEVVTIVPDTVADEEESASWSTFDKHKSIFSEENEDQSKDKKLKKEKRDKAEGKSRNGSEHAEKHNGESK